MNKIEAIIRPEKLEVVKVALAEQAFAGLNVVNVVGRGVQKGVAYIGRAGDKTVVDMLPKVKLEIVVRAADTEKALDTIIKAARTGNIGDGKIFVMPVTEVIRVRTGDRGEKVI